MQIRRPNPDSMHQRCVLHTILTNVQGRGEIAVREIFPEATIVRPPPMFGTEDRLLNPLAAPRFYFPSTTLDSPRVYPAYVFPLSRVY